MADSRPQPLAPVAAIDLDLAFAADPQLAPELLAAAGCWCTLPQAELAWQQLLAGWLSALQAELPPALQTPAYSLGLSLVGDAEIAALNGDWRQKPGPTDVLAFAAQDAGPEGDSPQAMPGPLELGDIVISVDTAARQAPEHGHNLAQELLFLASHGLLHLLGWDHPDEAALEAMLVRQEQLLALAPGGAGQQR